MENIVTIENTEENNIWEIKIGNEKFKCKPECCGWIDAEHFEIETICGKIFTLKNPYLTSVKFPGLDYESSDEATIEITQRHEK